MLFPRWTTKILSTHVITFFLARPNIPMRPNVCRWVSVWNFHNDLHWNDSPLKWAPENEVVTNKVFYKIDIRYIIYPFLYSRKNNFFTRKLKNLTCISPSMDPRKNSALISDLKMEKSRLQHGRQNPNRHVSINQPRQTHVLTFHFRIFVPNLDIFSRQTQNWILCFWWCLAWHQMALLVVRRGLTTIKDSVLSSTNPWYHKKMWNLPTRESRGAFPWNCTCHHFTAYRIPESLL